MACRYILAGIAGYAASMLAVAAGLSVGQSRPLSAAPPSASLVDSVASADADADVDAYDPLMVRGREIYLSSCAECHGEHGQGESAAYASPLSGDDSVGQLAQLIARTMPEGEPESCVGADAEAVAHYIHHSFYSEAARVRNRPPRISLSRLTADQLRQSLADLYEHFRSSSRGNSSELSGLVEAKGLRGTYFAGDRWKAEDKKIDRIDPTLDFDFGHQGPGEGIEPSPFYILWEGGIKAESTGRYEIIVRSTCSFVMYLGGREREFINNHVQSGDKTEFRQSVYLTAGRIYPLKLEFRQRTRKTELPPARISLSWIPPGGVERIVPSRNLVDSVPRDTFSLQTELPPDDRSYGYERGIAVNPQWDESTTAASLEFAQVAIDELWPEYRRRHRLEETPGRDGLMQFVGEIVQLAFRGALTPEVSQLYIDKQVAAEVDDAEAIRRALLISLKSPRFLFPMADQQQSLSQRIGNRLALVMYDSLPSDAELLSLIEHEHLSNEQKLRAYVNSHINDSRVQAKMRDTLHEWLDLGRFTELAKDTNLYPGFDADLAYDLRLSLEAFLDRIVWSQASDYRQLFLADWKFTTTLLGDFYGVDWQVVEAAGTLESPVENAQAGQLRVRGSSAQAGIGLLGHPYLLSGLAYYDHSSPIHRGVFLIRNMLGRTLRPPAEAFAPLSPDLHPDLTTRERVSLQTSPESCQVCHSRINSLGFVLENFDAAGRYRRQEHERDIISTGSYIDRAGNTVKFSGPEDLANYLADSDDAQRAFVNRVFQQFVKQPAAAYGPKTLEELHAQFRHGNLNMRELLVEVCVVASRGPLTEEADSQQPIE